jgi:hypothetical protein
MRGLGLVLALLAAGGPATAATSTDPVVDTGQATCYDDGGRAIACPAAGQRFAGQDAQHTGHQPRYHDNEDGTVSDLVTGLMWQKTPVYGLSYDAARAAASSMTTGDYSDWRLPTLKELYSLIDFTGQTGASSSESVPYLDTDVFDFEYGDATGQPRFIDAQYVSSTEYVGTTMGGDFTVFGVNFADGRIKGYPAVRPDGSTKTFHVRYVRGTSSYGVNDFHDEGDGTITDRATGLTWSKGDSGFGMDWEDALAWVAARNGEHYLGHDDWRLPNAKELQSLVDYTRAPDVSGSAAIDPLFETTPIEGDGYPYFWTSTTHLDGPPESRGDYAVYLAFGRALGWMESFPSSGDYVLLDVHGAGAQRSDPKSSDPADFP